jgi:hypothetical protein
VTGGTYTAACTLPEGTTTGNVITGALKSTAEKVVIDAIGTELHHEDYFGIEDHNPLYGRRRTPQLTFKAIDPDLLGGAAKPVQIKPISTIRALMKGLDQNGDDTFNGRVFSNVQGIFKDMTLCGILKKPISEAAALVKDLVTRQR